MFSLFPFSCINSIFADYFRNPTTLLKPIMLSILPRTLCLKSSLNILTRSLYQANCIYQDLEFSLNNTTRIYHMIKNYYFAKSNSKQSRFNCLHKLRLLLATHYLRKPKNQQFIKLKLTKTHRSPEFQMK